MTPAVWGGKLLIANQEGILFIIDPGTGELLEEIPTSAGQVVGSSIFIDGNRAIFAGRQGDLVCVDLAKRREVWNVRVPQENALIVHNPVGEHGNIFLYSRNTIFGYTIRDGTPLFTPIEGAATPPVVGKGFIIYGTLDNYLEIRRGTNGAEFKTIPLDVKISTEPVLAEDSIFVGTGTGEIIVIHPGW